MDDARGQLILRWTDPASERSHRIVIRGHGLDLVDAAGRLVLAARRDGAKLAVIEMTDDVAELFELAGLACATDPVDPLDLFSGGQVVGHPEGGEELGGVEERVDGRDPPV